MPPTVSIITPMYNAAATLADTIAGVVNQTWHDFEWIIVDDGSEDGSVEIIEQLADPRIVLVKSEHTGLPSRGRNTAYRRASGEFIAFLDADDIWLPEKLDAQLGYFRGNPGVGLVHTAVKKLIDTTTIDPPTTSLQEVTPASTMTATLLTGNPICTASVMVRRAALENVEELFDPDPQLCGPEDLDLWLRLAENGVDFGYISEPLTVYRVLPGSVSRNRRRDLIGTVVALQKAAARAPALYCQHATAYRRRLSYLRLQLGLVDIAGNSRRGRADIWAAIKTDASNWRAWTWMFLTCLGAWPVRLVDRYREHRRNASR